MRVAVRALATGMVAFGAVGLMMLTSTMVSIFTVTAVAATTALIMGGTGNPLSTEKDTVPFIQDYMGMAVNNYIGPSSTATPSTGIPKGPYNAVAVITPEEWAPQTGDLTLDQSIAEGVTNLDNCIKATDCVYNTDVGSSAPAASDSLVVFGYSQSATIGTFEKRRLAAEYPDGEGPDVSFEFIGNGNRPNGGFLARGPQGFTIPSPFIFGGATFSGPTPINTQYQTVDIAEQYDVWADVPFNPLNLLAVANWYSSYVHYNYKDASLDDPEIINQGQYGDTTYYMIPQKILPLLSSVTQVPVIGNALADALDAPLRVLVEAAYDRTISPGQPTPWNPLYFPNPIKLASDFVVAIPVGLDNALEDTIGIRPFGTQRPGPYGVGGPDVTYVNPPETAAKTESTATTEKSAAPESTASQSNTAGRSSSVSDSSAVVADAMESSHRVETPSDAVSEDGSTANDSTALAESAQSSTDPSSVASPKDVEGKKSLPDNVTTDVPAADAVTVRSPSDPKPGKEATTPTHPSRHALSGTTATSSKPIEKRISIVSTETGSAAASTSPSTDNHSTSQQSKAAHAH